MKAEYGPIEGRRKTLVIEAGRELAAARATTQRRSQAAFWVTLGIAGLLIGVGSLRAYDVTAMRVTDINFWGSILGPAAGIVSLLMAGGTALGVGQREGKAVEPPST